MCYQYNKVFSHKQLTTILEQKLVWRRYLKVILTLSAFVEWDLQL